MMITCTEILRVLRATSCLFYCSLTHIVAQFHETESSWQCVRVFTGILFLLRDFWSVPRFIQFAILKWSIVISRRPVISCHISHVSPCLKYTMLYCCVMVSMFLCHKGFTPLFNVHRSCYQSRI